MKPHIEKIYLFKQLGVYKLQRNWTSNLIEEVDIILG